MADLTDEISRLITHLDWLAVLDILLVALVIYGLLALVRGTQAVVLLRGIIFLVVATVMLTSFLRLPAFSWLLRNSLPALLIAVPVIFAPEIRRALERLGRAGTGININTSEAEQEQVIEAIANAAVRLSERRHGALIVIERQVGLKNYTDTGVSLDAIVSVELLVQVFYPNTPLHDGAVILKGSRIAAAACVMPLTSGENITDRQMGLRHRAALGISEVSDAVAVVVSEETGSISVAHNGRMIQRLDAARLRHILAAFYRPRGGGGVMRGLRRVLNKPRSADEAPRAVGD
jgi:diadenylate cyclase